MTQTRAVRGIAACAVVILVILLEVTAAPAVKSRFVLSVVCAAIASVAAAIIAAPRAWVVGACLLIVFGAVAVLDFGFAVVESRSPNGVGESLRVHGWTLLAAVVPFVGLNLFRRSH